MADAEVDLTKIPQDVKEQLHELELELSEGKFWALYKKCTLSGFGAKNITRTKSIQWIDSSFPVLSINTKDIYNEGQCKHIFSMYINVIIFRFKWLIFRFKSVYSCLLSVTAHFLWLIPVLFRKKIYVLVSVSH